jgi:hypothetical protein
MELLSCLFFVLVIVVKHGFTSLFLPRATVDRRELKGLNSDDKILNSNEEELSMLRLKTTKY